ncbi:glycosyltransferase family 1 protein [Mucilaginibacter terrenus]|uniref:Glycosyltransferase family 1 protein n=1 Tax=Mucilaginibacter terrenus TaxID=2482727 RepID=A0A3E2NTX7_9SPHI|nr:glycosyltransferase family 1 protein [Mucilaginibacter terrenus]RFZ84407.1 glycosyltransferase family 1 protein [Mucilaginibacter terrenus]
MKIINSNTEKDQVRSIYNTLPANLICFSHLRWDFVYQRPQHLLTRLSKVFNIFFIEEPICDATDNEYYEYLTRGNNLVLMVPHIKAGLNAEETKTILKSMFDGFMKNKDLSEYAFWYYTPMALDFSRKYSPDLIIFDCMDELSAFKFAPEELKNLEKEMLSKADVVFTGGHSLYEAKKNQHANIHAFPSSIEKEHFARAREITECPEDQAHISGPKLGFYGVIDERFDIELIRDIANARPEWQICLIGPVVKVDPETLPRNKNIHYLGPKSYQQLPEYLAHWDIALIPFMLNESTKFISPTKTPEYLAGGKPVISTPIKDVINPYGKNSLVHIANDAQGFIEAAEMELSNNQKAKWLSKVDSHLKQNSWDKTCSNMLHLAKEVINRKAYSSIAQ